MKWIDMKSLPLLDDDDLDVNIYFDVQVARNGRRFAYIDLQTGEMKEYEDTDTVNPKGLL